MNNGPAPATVVLALQGSIAAGDVPGLCRKAAGLVRETAADLIVCDLSGTGGSAAAVDALARIQMSVRRLGCQLRIAGCPVELQGLLALMGLQETFSVI